MVYKPFSELNVTFANLRMALLCLGSLIPHLICDLVLKKCIPLSIKSQDWLGFGGIGNETVSPAILSGKKGGSIISPVVQDGTP